MIQFPLEQLLEQGLGKNFTRRIYGEEIRLGSAVDDELNEVSLKNFREKAEEAHLGGYKNLGSLMRDFLSFSGAQMDAYFDEMVPLYLRMSGMIGTWQIIYEVHPPAEEEPPKNSDEPVTGDLVDYAMGRLFSSDMSTYKGTEEEADQLVREGKAYEIMHLYFKGKTRPTKVADIEIVYEPDGDTGVISGFGVRQFPSDDPKHLDLTVSLTAKQDSLRELLALHGKKNTPEVFYRALMNFLNE